MTSRLLEWRDDLNEVSCAVAGITIFRDGRDHWENGVLRLLGLSPDAGRAWVEEVASQSVETRAKDFRQWSPEEKVDLLVSVSRHCFGLPPAENETPPQGSEKLQALGHPVDYQWFSQIRDRADLAVVGSRQLQHGILSQCGSGCWSLAREAQYEEDYFEGATPGVGYGGYREQAPWREEKAAKLVRRIQGIASSLGRPLPPTTRLLDVGSGYGYFRNAAQSIGWAHEGIEVSGHAIQVARQEFGFNTFAGTLDDLVRSRPEPFDVIALFDTVEHVTEPLALLRSVTALLAPQGFCVIRTPNLCALEARVFGRWYHSLKPEHLHYFSPESLCFALVQSGLAPLFLTSDSHLLSGFLESALHSYARLLRGSDLFAVGQRQT